MILSLVPIIFLTALASIVLAVKASVLSSLALRSLSVSLTATEDLWFVSKTRTEPVVIGVLIATAEPSPDRLTDVPERPPLANPSISVSTWVQFSSTFSKTRIVPVEVLGDPMATTEPSLDKLTEEPDWWYGALPSISLPTCIQYCLKEFSNNLKIRTVPTLSCLLYSSWFHSLWYGEPIATIEPSLDKLTEKPVRSWALIPSRFIPISPPCWDQLSSKFLKTRTELLLGEPIATIEPSYDRLTELAVLFVKEL